MSTATQKQTPCRSVLMVGTDTSTMGGISTVVRGYLSTRLFNAFSICYVPTHRDGGGVMKLLAALRGWARVAWQLARMPSPLVHIHLSSRASFWRKLVVCRLARIFGRPYILHVHGSEFMEFYRDELSPRAQRIVRHAFADAALVLALSEQWKTQLQEICSTVPIEILPNGVPMPDISARSALDSAQQTILFLGRLGRRKGTYELIEAFGQIASEFPGARLVCAGDGDLGPFQARVAELGIADRVEFPGWTSIEETRRHLSAATIFALPSHAEGLPMALLEAMSWQLAVVVSSVGGIPRVVHDRDNGLLIIAGDVQSLTTALKALLSDGSFRERLARAARITVESDYSLNATVNKLARIYARFGLSPKEVLTA